MISRSWTITLLAGLSLTGACDSPSGPGQPSAVHVGIVSGDQQTGIVASALPSPLVVKVTDEKGRAMAGQTVSFRIAEGNGTLATSTAVTDAQGVASDQWTLGSVAGSPQRAVAAVSATGAAPADSAIFTATAAPGASVPLQVVAGDQQLHGKAGAPQSDSLAVRVVNASGTPLAGVAVTWAVTSGGGSVSPAVSTTNSAGIAKTLWTLGPVLLVEGQTVTASAASHETVTFQGAADDASNLIVERAGGEGQSGQVSAALPAPLTVLVRLPDGRPVKGARVAWDPDSSAVFGETLPARGQTDAAGHASTTWTLGSASGEQRVLATVSPTASVVFHAHAVGYPAYITIAGGNNQTASAGSKLPVPLAVRITDAANLPVPGRWVRWSNYDQAFLSADSSLTDADGVARVEMTFPNSAGTYQSTATVAGLRPPLNGPTSATFLENSVGPVGVRIVGIAPGATVTDTLLLVRAYSNAPPATVTATVDGRSVTLTYQPYDEVPKWSGTLNLSGLAHGTKTLTVRTVVAGGSGDVSLTFNYQ